MMKLEKLDIKMKNMKTKFDLIKTIREGEKLKPELFAEKRMNIIKEIWKNAIKELFKYLKN